MERKIIIRTMRLLNFKGIRDLKITFGAAETTIMGCNGSGKTTVFDAFTWLLFGKDSLDRKAFGVKTRDGQGNEIPKLPHEVSAEISVNGQRVTLTRRLNEKWVKRRGDIVEEFAGNTEERLYDDVPCSVKDWQDKINAICPELTFKFITNPLYFSAQKPDVQRAMLLRMAGGVSDGEVAAGNADFEALLASLGGKTIEELKREIAAKKRRLKAEIEGIPERIDERRRDMPEAEDWAALSAELEAKQSKLAEIESQLADAAKALAAANEARLEATRRAGKLEQQRLALEDEIRGEAEAGYYEARRRQQRLKIEIAGIESDIRRAIDRKTAMRTEMEQCNGFRARLLAEWRTINAERLVFSDGDFICPTCKRPLDVADIEARQQEMTEAFNARKAERLADNVKRGKANTARMQDIEADMAAVEAEISEANRQLQQKQSELAEVGEPVRPDTTAVISGDGRYQALAAQARQAKAEAESEAATGGMADNAELKEGWRILVEAIGELKARLAKKGIIERNNARIAELERQLRAQSEELAQLEGKEFTIAAFGKAKIETVEGKINGMFSTVRFRMFERQINGGEVETCEAMVSGVPYSDLNNAGRINAGIDIINAICRSEGISAPIVIDNAEAVNHLQPTSSQLIRLMVTMDKKLAVVETGGCRNNTND